MLTPPGKPAETPTNGPAVAVVAWRDGWCNEQLAAAWRDIGLSATRMAPPRASACLRAGDVALNRIDVRFTLDGVEPGSDMLEALRESGVRVLNREAAMLVTHDKLETSLRLGHAGIPQPETISIGPGEADIALTPPLVVKPRFGSWGREVLLCRELSEVDAALRYVRGQPWFPTGGAVAQAFVPHQADLRLVIAGGRLVGAVERRPAAGEWRTNFSLGGSRHQVIPPAAAVSIAIAAASVVGTDLVGVDLLLGPRGYLVLELNGAVDFDRMYSLPGRDAFFDVADALSIGVGFPEVDVRSSADATLTR